MNRFALFSLILGVVLVGVSISDSQTHAAPQVATVDWITQIQQRYRSLKSIQATFQQTIVDPLFPANTSSGTVYFSLPGKMRWEYLSPVQKWIVRNGDLSITMDVADKQAITGRVQGEDEAIAFLWGRGDLRRQFHIVSLEEKKEVVEIVLQPVQPIFQVERLRLTYHRQLQIVVQIVLEDAQKRENRIVFSNIQLDKPFASENLFSPVFPKDVEVIDLSLPARR